MVKKDYSAIKNKLLVQLEDVGNRLSALQQEFVDIKKGTEESILEAQKGIDASKVSKIRKFLGLE